MKPAVDFESLFSRMADRAMRLRRGLATPVRLPHVDWSTFAAKSKGAWLTYGQAAKLMQCSDVAVQSYVKAHPKKFEKRTRSQRLTLVRAKQQ